jgi:hypothetical protein
MKRPASLVPLAVAATIAATAARASPEPTRAIDLALRHLPAPLPSSLAMRAARPKPRVAAAPLPTPPRTQGPSGPTLLRQDAGELAAPGRRLEEKIIFRFNIGFGIDGGQPSGRGELLSGVPLDESADYARLRSYGFGDLVLGTRGLLVDGLGSYFAAQFRFDQNLRQPTQAVPNVHYADEVEDFLVRSAYAEWNPFRRPWLRPLYFRAGRQFKYGVAVAHFDGLTLGYDTRPVSASLWFGSRVSLYGLGQDPTGPQAEFAGASARVDLYELRRIPIVLTADTLEFGDFGHREYGVAFRWKPDILIRGSVRQLDSQLARQTLAVWARLSEVTTLTAEVDNRSADDWIYDLIVMRPPSRAGDLRNYLNLGPPLPRLQLDVRAGTVLLRNLDVLLRGAAAFEHAGEDEDAAFSPSYVEGGAAVEVRLRRNVRVGSTFTARRYQRDVADEVEDTGALPDPLPEFGSQAGELSFYEGGVGIDYSLGARRFSASGELYGRLYERQSQYQTLPVDDGDFRSGGRFSVEGWAANRLRIKAEYDVSLANIALAPELRGIKSLRVLAEGSF